MCGVGGLGVELVGELEEHRRRMLHYWSGMLRPSSDGRA
jgi:NADH dehydrogenase FAD-containing subunit